MAGDTAGGGGLQWMSMPVDGWELQALVAREPGPAQALVGTEQALIRSVWAAISVR